MLNLTDHRILQSFVTVSRVGNVTRAAEILNLTQPAISQHLKRLSEETGLVLFRRVAGGLELTKEGSILSAKAELALTALMEVGQTARQLTGQVKGRLRIGTIIDPEFIRLGAVLMALVRMAPGVEPQLVHGTSGEILRRVVAGEIDACFFLGDPEAQLSPPPGEALDVEPVFADRPLAEMTYRIVAPPGWAGRVRGRSLAELARLPWIATPDSSVHNRLLSRAFAEAGAVQNKVALVDQEPSMLTMVRSGVGLCLCRDTIAREERRAHGLVVVEGPAFRTTLRFVTLTSRRRDPRIACAFRAVDEVWGEGGASA